MKMKIRPKRIYLATPYTHKNFLKRQLRYARITRITSYLVSLGFHIFSPITHAHPINVFLKRVVKIDSKGFDYWKTYDLTMIAEWADELWVVPLEGWKSSKGVQAEIDFARSINIPVKIQTGLIEKFKNWKKILLGSPLIKIERPSPEYYEYM